MSNIRLEAEVLEALSSVCERRRFGSGQQITAKGAFARTMFFVLSGWVEIRFHEAGGGHSSLRIGENSALGEMGFLTGKAASASAVAVGEVFALELDHDRLDALEAQNPQAAIAFSRYLAGTVDRRLQHNRDALGEGWHEATSGISGAVEVVRCVEDACLLNCQQLRYEVYCEELQRSSPYANEETKTLSDPLDDFGVSFLGSVDGKPAGTARVNLAREGDLGLLIGLYGMDKSASHPDETAVITKFAVSKQNRNGAVYAGLLNAVITYLDNSKVAQIYMDGVPDVARFYTKFGFNKCADEFMHYENGLSIPMVLEADYFRSAEAKAHRTKLFSKLGLNL